MPTLYRFWFVFLCIILYSLSAYSEHDQGSLASLQEQARLEQRPLVVWVYEPDATDAKRMRAHTWRKEELQSLLTEKFISYTIENSDPERAQLPLPHSKAASLLLILHPSGGLMGSVDGYVAPPTLSSILQRHWKRLHPVAPQALPVLRKPTPTIAVQYPADRTYDLEVDGLESYSLSQLSLSQPTSPAVGVLMGSYQHPRQLARDIRRLKKRWPGQMWVYASQESDGPQSYNLVLGNFEDARTAQRYATAMQRYTARETDLLDLRQIVGFVD